MMRRVTCLKHAVIDGKSTNVPDRDGWFHEWGVESDEHGSYTVAIVEHADGEVAIYGTSMIRFIDPLCAKLAPPLTAPNRS